MYLERDAFWVGFDPREVGLERILGRVRKLGYDPSAVATHEGNDPVGSGSGTVGNGTPRLPNVLLTQSVEDGKKQFVFVDFNAKWCAPCRVLERTVLSKGSVREALKPFQYVKVDTDAFPDVAKDFGVVGLPTLVVIDRDGTEHFRHLGPISVDDLIRSLAALQEEAAQSTEPR